MNVHVPEIRDEWNHCLNSNHKSIADCFEDAVMLLKNVINETSEPTYGFIDNRAEVLFAECMKIMSELRSDEINARTIDLIFLLAPIAASEKDLCEIKVALNKVLSANPEHVGALTQLGCLFYGCYDYENAVPYLKKALSLDPGRVEALLPLVDIFRKSVTEISQRMGNRIQEGPEEAVEYLEVALRHNPDRQIFDALIDTLHYSVVPGSGRKALEYLTRALETAHNDTALLRAVAKIYREGVEDEEENIALAISYLEKILAIDESDFDAIMQLADMYNTGCKDMPRNCRLSIEYLERAARINPTSTAPFVQLAVMYMNGGPEIAIDLIRSVSYLDRALEIDATDRMALQLVVEIYRNGGTDVPRNLYTAITYLQKALDQDPHFTPALIRLARIYDEGGGEMAPDPVQARIYWERAGFIFDDSEAEDPNELLAAELWKSEGDDLALNFIF